MNIKTIWTEYQSNLKAFLHSKVDNPEDVKDLLQDILIKTHLNMHSLKESSKVKSWIFQIANNTIIDFYRKKRKGRNISPEALWYEQEEPQILKELSQCVLPFINSLSPSDAELLVAIEIEGKSQKTYAKNNNLNYSTLKSRVKKSRQELYRLFNNCCDFSLDSQGNLIEYQTKGSRCTKC